MRLTIFGLLAATALSTSAFAQGMASPFGAPSSPLTQEELDSIHAESAARKAAIAKAAAKAKAKREAAQMEKEKAIDSTSAPAPVSTPEVIEAAPAPMGATTDTTTIIQPGTAPTTVAPVAAPVDPLAPAPADALAPAPADALAPASEAIPTAPITPTVMEPAGAGSNGTIPATE